MSFPILYSCLLCWRLIDYRCVDSFLVSLSCSIDLIFLYQYYTVLSTVALQHCLKPGWVILLVLHLFLRIILAVLGLLLFHTNIWIICSGSVENVMDNLIRIALNLKIAFAFSSVTQSCPTLQPYGLQHARLPCPSPTPGACSNSCPSSQWCHPTRSSSVIPFSSCLPFPSSGFLQMSQLFASCGQSIGVSASASVLLINIQGLFPLELTCLISL